MGVPERILKDWLNEKLSLELTIYRAEKKIGLMDASKALEPKEYMEYRIAVFRLKQVEQNIDIFKELFK